MQKREIWERALPFLADRVRSLGAEVEWNLAPPATSRELTALENDIGMSLPEELRLFLLRISGDLLFCVNLHEDTAPPPDFDQLQNWGLSISVEGIRTAETIRKEWIRSVYDDVEDPYSLVWHGKLGLLNLPEGYIISGEEMARELKEHDDWAWGDVIAIDVSPSADPQSLLYLSHDGAEIHGDVIALDLNAYLHHALALGCVGAGTYASYMFTELGVGLQSDTEKGKLFRNWIGWNGELI